MRLKRLTILFSVLALLLSPLARAHVDVPAAGPGAAAGAVLHAVDGGSRHDHGQHEHAGSDHVHEAGCTTPSCSGGGSSLPPAAGSFAAADGRDRHVRFEPPRVDQLRDRPPLRPPRAPR